MKSESEMLDRIAKITDEGETEFRNLRERGSDSEIRSGYASLVRDLAARIRCEVK